MRSLRSPGHVFSASFQPHVSGKLCNECKSGTFYLSEKNQDGCLKCFCMGVTRECSSSYWNREQVRESRVCGVTHPS